MDFKNFLFMRHELLLTLIAAVILIAEIFTTAKNKKSIINLALVCFGLITIVGFLPTERGAIFGGMYQTSPMHVMMKNILNIGVFIFFLQSSDWIRKPENNQKISEYFILIISTLIGMDFMISSGDFLMFYIGLETASIPLAALVAYDKIKNKSAEAGVKFILISALSSGILLYGISMIYGTTGSIYFTEVSKLFYNEPLQILAFIFFFAGMAFKISLVPFHLWTADVYEGAPVNITAYLSVISKGAATFIFTIVLFKVFKNIVAHWSAIIWIISLITMTIGNLFAMRQTNIKRFFAFSSISQAGFILLGILGNSQLGMATILYFVLIYIFSNLGAFGVISIISNRTGKENISDYNGLYQTNPKLSLIMMLALFSLAGIPPVAGFFGKYFLFTAAAQKGFFLLVLIAVLNTIISLYYYLVVVKAMFIDKNENPIEPIKSDLNARIALIICVLGIFAVGLASGIFELFNRLGYGIV
jgi:NADH-quinone oxidoreductase subunit N